MNYIDTMDKEKTDLELHVDLCAERYAELDRRLGKMETLIQGVISKIDTNREFIIKTCIATAGSIIVAVIGLAGVILTKLG